MIGFISTLLLSAFNPSYLVFISPSPLFLLFLSFGQSTTFMVLFSVPCWLTSCLIVKQLISGLHAWVLSRKQSCPALFWPHGLQPSRLLCPWNFPGKNTGMGCHFFLQGIFLTQGLKLCLPHWQADSLALCCTVSLAYYSLYIQVCPHVMDGRTYNRTFHSPSTFWAITVLHLILLILWNHNKLLSYVQMVSCVLKRFFKEYFLLTLLCLISSTLHSIVLVHILHLIISLLPPKGVCLTFQCLWWGLSAFVCLKSLFFFLSCTEA